MKIIREYFEYTLGDKSHMNLAGKIILFPVVVLFLLVYVAFDVCFTKKKQSND